MSQREPLYEPRLTEDELAAAVGLDVPTVRRYCQTFAVLLESSGHGPDQRWAPISTSTLELIHQLCQAGQSPENIYHLFGRSAERPPTDPEDDAPLQAIHAALPEEPPADPSPGTWRGVPTPPPSPPPPASSPRPWWRRWWPR